MSDKTGQRCAGAGRTREADKSRFPPLGGTILVRLVRAPGWSITDQHPNSEG